MTTEQRTEQARRLLEEWTAAQRRIAAIEAEYKASLGLPMFQFDSERTQAVRDAHAGRSVR